jgi:transcriptional regulator of heat shock response
LERLAEQLRALCVGRTLADARVELLALQNEHEARFDRLLAEALRVGLALTAGVWFDPLWLQVAGKPTLARELGGVESLSAVLGLLEDTQRLAEVLCQLLPDPAGTQDVRAQVRVDATGALLRSGSDDEPRLAMGLPTLALVGCRLPDAGPTSGSPAKGAVALLGTDRMDYAAVIPLVEYAARALAARMCA